MSEPKLPRPRHVRLLLSLLADPAGSVQWPVSDWELVIRTGRMSKLLGTLYVRLEEAGLLGRIPTPATQLLQGDFHVAEHRRAMAEIEVRAIEHALRDYDGPLILLKGAAYAALGLRAGRGRIFEDVDILVPKAHLQDVEDRLIFAGWESETPDDYDQHYYREWAHELPPMRFPGRHMQLDVHHTIAPVTARYRPDPRRLIDGAKSIAGTRFSALNPAHRVMHAAAHVFADSDCVSKLRDLVDLDALIREQDHDSEFWERLVDESARAGLARPLWYGLSMGRAWAKTPVPDSAWRLLDAWTPSAPVRICMAALLASTLPPPAPERSRALLRSLAGRVLFLRYLWLRMPLRILLYHAFRKSLRTLRKKIRPPATAADQ